MTLDGVDLTGSPTVRLVAKGLNVVKAFSGNCTILDVALKRVRYTPQATDVNVAGLFAVEWEVAGNSTTPNTAPEPLLIRADLD